MTTAKLVRVGPLGGLEILASNVTDARFLYREIFEGHAYDRAVLPPSPVVIDVGANIGVFTLYVKLRDPDARVLAFEPVPELADLLRRNVALHGLDGVVVHSVALSDRADDATTFTNYPMAPSSSTRYPESLRRHRKIMEQVFPARLLERMYRGREITVRAETLSSFLHAHTRVDLLKIDAVGAELDVLRGIDDHHWPLIRQVVIDVQNQDGRLESVASMLQGRGFVVDAGPAAFAGDDGLNFQIHASRR